MRRVRTRGGRRGGYSGGPSSSETVNPNVFALHRSRLVDIFPDVNYQSAHILLELCEGNVVRAIDNVLYAQELRRNVLSVFNDSRKLAFANLSDEQCNQSAAQNPTESPPIPSTSSGEHLVIQGESVQQKECQSEPKQTSHFMEDISMNEELINAVEYITEHVECSPNHTSSTSQELPNELIDCEFFFEQNSTQSATQENKEHVKHDVYPDYSHAQSISEQQSPQTVGQNQKVNQRAGKVTIGQTTYVMKKLPKDLPLEDLPSIAKHREILEKLVNQPIQKLK